MLFEDRLNDLFRRNQTLLIRPNEPREDLYAGVFTR